jgi:hypothetical protein
VSPGRKHLAWLREPVLDAAADRRLQRGVGDERLQPHDFRLGHFDRGRGVVEAGEGRPVTRFRDVQLAAALIEPFGREVAFVMQDERALVLLFRQRVLALALRDGGLGLQARMPGATHLGLGATQLRLQLAVVHARQQRAGLDHVAFIGADLDDAAGDLRRDLDLLGLDPAVRLHDPLGQARPALLQPDVVRARRDGEREGTRGNPADRLHRLGNSRRSASCDHGEGSPTDWSTPWLSLSDVACKAMIWINDGRARHGASPIFPIAASMPASAARAAARSCSPSCVRPRRSLAMPRP